MGPAHQGLTPGSASHWSVTMSESSEFPRLATGDSNGSHLQGGGEDSVYPTALRAGHAGGRGDPGMPRFYLQSEFCVYTMIRVLFSHLCPISPRLPRPPTCTQTGDF